MTCQFSFSVNLAHLHGMVSLLKFVYMLCHTGIYLGIVRPTIRPTPFDHPSNNSSPDMCRFSSFGHFLTDPIASPASVVRPIYLSASFLY